MQPEIAVRGVAPLLTVFDVPTSIAFYREVLGFELVSAAQPGDYIVWALLRLGDAELMLEPIYVPRDRPSAPDPARAAAHHDTAIYFGCANVDEAWERVRAHVPDARPPRIAPYGMHQLYLTDPDGYLLCFQWPASEATRAEWRARYGDGVVDGST